MAQPTHELRKQISYLQQSLSSDKRPLAFFLGAGCPMSIRTEDGKPLISDIAGITKAVREKLTACKERSPLLKILDSHFEKDEITNPSIEYILSHIRSLKAVAGKDIVRGFSSENLDQLDTFICDHIEEVVNKEHPSASSPYHHISMWVDAIRREKPVEIFTTNYDLLMEQALETSRVPYFDGFSGSNHPFFDLQAVEEDILPPRWTRLWKLHGSINWYQTNETGVFRSMVKPTASSRRLIHPSHLKYDQSRRMPYLAMIDRIRAFIKQPNSVVIISGYSFKDEHLNEVIVQSLQSSPSSIAFALLYSSLENYPEAIKLASHRPNLSLLADDGGVLSSIEGKWPQQETSESISNSTPWMTWVPADSSKPTETHNLKCLLGDFLNLGEFVRTLVGRNQDTAS